VSYALVGPFPFDANTVTACGRFALNSVASDLRAGRGAELMEASLPGTDPGLYIVLRHDEARDPEPAIDGYYIVLDSAYLVSGPVGPPDRVPPFAQELLDAATEEVWWQNLQVTRNKKDGAWRPFVVLEWPPFMANRSAASPPGVEYEDEQVFQLEADEPEFWLEAVEAPKADRSVAEDVFRTAGSDSQTWSHLSENRSVTVIVRGLLQHDGKLHTGSYFMVPPELLDDGSRDLLPAEDWMAQLETFDVEEANEVEREDDAGHVLTRPLELPGGRVGFVSSGWLTRGLSLWPARPKDIHPGVLTDRVVQQRWKSQLKMAVNSSVVVLVSVLGFSLAVAAMAEPKPEPMEPPPPPAAQPAMAACTADYSEFVNEFRCQIRAMAGSGLANTGTPVCGDAGSTQSVSADLDEDLQAAYCGLLDREQDGKRIVLPNDELYNFGEFAAAQSCYNVLGNPFKYQAGVMNGRDVGNPHSFLEDEALGIQPLKVLVEELNTACKTYRQRTEARVEGAVFATHIGNRLGEPETESEPAALRRMAVDVGLSAAPAETQACFRKGVRDGVDALEYSAFCSDEPDGFDTGMKDGSKMWRLLGSQAEEVVEHDVVDAYFASRFPTEHYARPELWQCHDHLAHDIQLVNGVRRGRWDVTTPVPNRYSVDNGAVDDQLTMDGIVLASRDGQLSAGVCWGVVSRRLSAYGPVHPLLGQLDPEAWPSVEQRVCGQICAARFQLRSSANMAGWVTPKNDIGRCVSVSEPGKKAKAGLDRLRLPWNYFNREYQKPNAAQVCAYNLVAQQMLETESLEAPLLASFTQKERTFSPKEFSGEVEGSNGVVGGKSGFAVTSVASITSRKASANFAHDRCAATAVQCFTSILLDVTSNKDVERYQWLAKWQQELQNLTRRSPADIGRGYRRSGRDYIGQPWCVALKEYFDPTRAFSQMDSTCEAGVLKVRGTFETIIRDLEESRVGGNAG